MRTEMWHNGSDRVSQMNARDETKYGGRILFDRWLCPTENREEIERRFLQEDS